MSFCSARSLPAKLADGKMVNRTKGSWRAVIGYCHLSWEARLPSDDQESVARSLPAVDGMSMSLRTQEQSPQQNSMHFEWAISSWQTQHTKHIAQSLTCKKGATRCGDVKEAGIAESSYRQTSFSSRLTVNVHCQRENRGNWDLHSICLATDNLPENSGNGVTKLLP